MVAAAYPPSPEGEGTTPRPASLGGLGGVFPNDRVLAWAGFGLLAALTLGLRLHALGEPLERDLTGFAYFAHQWLAGDRLYTDLWDTKPPGVFIIFALGELLLGYRESTVVWIGVAFTLGTLGCLFPYLRERLGTAAAWAGGLWWVCASNTLSILANLPKIEMFINTFIMLALWALGRYARGGRPAWLWTAGTTLAAASYCKMHVLFPWLGAAAWLLLRRTDASWARRCREVAVLGWPGLVLWSGTLAYVWAAGRWEDFHGALFVHAGGYAGDILANVWHFFSTPGLWLPAPLSGVRGLLLLAAAGVLTTGLRRFPEGRSALLWIAGGLVVAVASTPKYFMYYYQLLLVPGVLLAVFFLSDLFRWLRRHGRAAAWAGVLAPALLVTAWLGRHQLRILSLTPEELSISKYQWEFVNTRTLGHRIRDLTRPGDSVYEWGAETGIYFYSRRRAASGVIYLYSLFKDAPPGLQARLVKRVVRDVREAAPAVFVHNTWEWYGPFEANPLYAYVMEHYHFHERFAYFDIYLRKPEQGDEGPGTAAPRE